MRVNCQWITIYSCLQPFHITKNKGHELEPISCYPYNPDGWVLTRGLFGHFEKNSSPKNWKLEQNFRKTKKPPTEFELL